MTREELMKKRWRGYEEIEFRSQLYDGVVVSCMLLSVDFEQELFKLVPIDKETYEDQPFWARVEYCKRPAPKLKVVKTQKDK